MQIKKLVLVLVVSVGIASCSNDDGSPRTPNVKKFVGTQAPGDVWEWEMNYDEETLEMTWDYGTFDDQADDINIKGDFVLLPSGYYKVTITDVTPASAEVPEDGTAFFYALEIPGTALIVKPEGSIKGDIIMMVAEGDCANVAGEYNYIITAPGDPEEFNSVTDESFGQVSFVENGNTYTITGTKKSLDCLGDVTCTVNGEITDVPVATCIENGSISIMDVNGRTTAQGQFTNGGVMMLDMGKGNGGVFGVKKSAITIADFSAKSFNGIAYFPTYDDDDKNVPVSVEFESGTGVALGSKFTNIETGTIDNEEAVNLQIKNITNGLATGTIFHQDGHKDFAAAVIENDGKIIMVLTSSNNDEGNPPFILVLTSK